MKILLAIIVLGVSGGSPAFAVVRAPSTATHYTCEGSGLSRIAVREDPAPCCIGMFGCPQLLSNTGLVKPKQSRRT